MQYLYVPLGGRQLPILTLPEGDSAEFPLFQIECNPLIPLETLKSDDLLDTIKDTALQAQEALAAQLQAPTDELARSCPEANYLAVLVRTDPYALAIDRPPITLYDPPAYYDDELDERVVPEGAVPVGETPGYVGWAYGMILGLGVLDELPDGMEPLDEFPFYAVEPDVFRWNADDLMSTPRGRAQLAHSLGATLTFGKKPDGTHLNISELVARHAARQETTA